MRNEIIIQNSGNGKIYDITEVVSKITLDEKIEGSPTKISFKFKVDSPIELENGSVVRYTHNGIKKFYGFVFKIGTTQDEEIDITAYDQLRYFKNKDTYVFKTNTLEERLREMAKKNNLRTGRIDTTGAYLPSKIYDNKTMGDVLQDGIDQLLRNTGRKFMIRDNFGELELINISTLKTNLVVTGGSLLSTFNYEESIDSDTYNQVKIIKDNKDTKKREVYMVKDSNNQRKWGLLQYYASVDEKTNDAQIRQKAEVALKHYNREKKKLTLECLGDDRVRAGSGLYIDIASKNGRNFKQYVLVTAVKNTYDTNTHTMSLEVEVE